MFPALKKAAVCPARFSPTAWWAYALCPAHWNCYPTTGTAVGRFQPHISGLVKRPGVRRDLGSG